MTPLRPLSEDEKDPWEKLFTSDKAYRVQILASLLEAEEIPSVILNQQDSSYVILGDIKLMVRRSDLLRAEQILEKFMKNE